MRTKREIQYAVGVLTEAMHDAALHGDTELYAECHHYRAALRWALGLRGQSATRCGETIAEAALDEDDQPPPQSPGNPWWFPFPPSQN